MKWYGLWKKIGKQNLSKMMKADVYIVIDDEEIPLLVRFKDNGEPYLIKKEG